MYYILLNIVLITGSDIMIKIRWTGAAGIEFIVDSGVILIDPYFSRLGKFKSLFKNISPKKENIENYLNTLPSELIGVIAGHTHLDHTLDIPYIAQKSGCKIIGSKSLDSLFRMHGLAGRVIICKGNEKIDLNDKISVTMIPSIHGKVIFDQIPFPGEIDSNGQLPIKAKDYKAGKVFIPKITLDGKTFMHIGSADYVESQLQGHSCDILFMCVPGWKRKKGYTSTLIELLHPGIVVPFHFDDFSRPIPKTGKTPLLPFQGVSDFVHEIKKNFPEVKIILPEMNQDIACDLF